ncbi:YqcI/YcgG family protein [Halobacillus litoralis]|uniref:YqcI/YcgG family protein n=1 Tax=Halobacillus litoralis TaxID=45668 RepID=UPI001CD3C0B4|nr:YqcI/YcgG family protein [Halobacillus litoralis]MCA0971687.1 YqcI/YcgG family protein [Halobacillus litoralis]
METENSLLQSWQQSAYDYFAHMMTDRTAPYPCVPGVQGFLQDSLRFGFTGDPRSEQAAEQFADLLKDYGRISRETGPYASLVVFFDTRSFSSETTIDHYQSVFWSLIQRIHELDQAPWPEHVSPNPDDSSWEFCFDGEPYFIFCATPAHEKRKSRQFPHFLIALQPRWVFEDIHDGTAYGRKLKSAIRKRLEDYDSRPPHPSLKWYGQNDNLEWEQYFLADDENTPPKCPFMNRMNRIQR